MTLDQMWHLFVAGGLVVLAASHLWHLYVYHGARRARQREQAMWTRLVPPRLPTPPRRPGSR